MVRRSCWSPTLLILLLVLRPVLRPAESAEHAEEHRIEAGFDGFVRSLLACKANTGGNSERLACITAQVCARMLHRRKIEDAAVPLACMHELNTADPCMHGLQIQPLFAVELARVPAGNSER